MSKVIDCSIEVRYADTDQMAVVYYANFFIWMEVARTKWLKEVCGVEYGYMEKEDGLFIPVLEAHCRYQKPVRYPSTVMIRTQARRERLSIIFDYEFIGEGEQKAVGFTRHIIVDKNMKPLRRLPSYILDNV